MSETFVILSGRSGGGKSTPLDELARCRPVVLPKSSVEARAGAVLAELNRRHNASSLY
jgi:predicted ATPase